MNMTDILLMAREADLWLTSDERILAVERFAHMVAQREREACARLAEKTVCDTHLPTGVKIYGSRVAKAIRERDQA